MCTYDFINKVPLAGMGTSQLFGDKVPYFYHKLVQIPHLKPISRRVSLQEAVISQTRFSLSFSRFLVKISNCNKTFFHFFERERLKPYWTGNQIFSVREHLHYKHIGMLKTCKETWMDGTAFRIMNPEQSSLRDIHFPLSCFLEVCKYSQRIEGVT